MLLATQAPTAIHQPEHEALSPAVHVGRTDGREGDAMRERPKAGQGVDAAVHGVAPLLRRESAKRHYLPASPIEATLAPKAVKLVCEQLRRTPCIAALPLLAARLLLPPL